MNFHITLNVLQLCYPISYELQNYFGIVSFLFSQYVILVNYIINLGYVFKSISLKYRKYVH
jgi:hypothetical protein